MKVFPCLLFLTALLIGCLPTKKDVWIQSEPFQQWCRAAFTSDSGFISLRQSQQLERFICQLDTTILPFICCKACPNRGVVSIFPQDSLQVLPDSLGGKYFRVPEVNGVTRWILCLDGDFHWQTPYIIEFQQQNRFTLTGWERFYHGNHECCWDGPVGGFYRIGPYFFIETCGTGSSFCSGSVHLIFFPLNSGKEDTLGGPGIPVFHHDAQSSPDILLKGELHLQNDSIIADYVFESAPVDGWVLIYKDAIKKYRFRAYFKIDTLHQRVQLLNRDSIIQHEELTQDMFYWLLRE